MHKYDVFAVVIYANSGLDIPGYAIERIAGVFSVAFALCCLFVNSSLQ